MAYFHHYDVVLRVGKCFDTCIVWSLRLHCQAGAWRSQVSRRPACYDQLFGKLEWHHKTIKAESSLDWKLLAEIKETFQESELPFRADVLDWNDRTE
ncbi:MAG: hypothetical protein HGB06_05220 [Chlorobaculum sp.]|jgi:hypothetical protein|nr:hypothetical protein [Chlorobaculum sp.]